MNISRRQLLQLMAGVVAWRYIPPVEMSPARYLAGVSNSSEPYVATKLAVQASGEWPSARMNGRPVVIKPNLVTATSSETGQTTDPQVVRALVDLALDAGAAQILIVENGLNGAFFSGCGYDFFANYDTQGRVALVDLKDEPVDLVNVPHGLAFQQMYIPRLLMDEGLVFISVAKLKTHTNAMVTLTMKNLFGLVPVAPYQNSPLPWRLALHDRSVNQTIVDLNQVRPVDFAVIDGIWAMEGNGPTNGTPVKVDLIVAGRNAVAVDRVGTEAMGIPQTQVQHLQHAAAQGLGPSDLAQIDTAGDPLPSHTFVRPDIAPLVSIPACSPALFDAHAGQEASISYTLDRAGRTLVEVVQAPDATPAGVQTVRILQAQQEQPAGAQALAWDGCDDTGNLVPAGRYGIRVTVDSGPLTRVGMAIGWVIVAEAQSTPTSTATSTTTATVTPTPPTGQDGQDIYLPFVTQ